MKSLPCSSFRRSHLSRAALGLFVTLFSLGDPASAQTLSTSREVNFYRDVPSRSLDGLAARSDGALVSGPRVSPLDLPLDADLLWSAAETGGTLFLGTGPAGKLLSYHLAAADSEAPLIPAETITLPHDSHLLALATLPDGGLLAGSSPEGALSLVQDGQVIARSALPVGSILAISVHAPALDQAAPTAKNTEVLVATGAPARIYKVDLAKFRASGIGLEKLPADDEAALAERGFTLWGSVRDENLRSLLRLADGRVIAGSAPKGNVYEFPASGGSPRVLAENNNAEVTTLLGWDDGFYAAITRGDTQRRQRLDSSSSGGGSLRSSVPTSTDSSSGSDESGDSGDDSGSSEEGGSAGGSRSDGETRAALPPTAPGAEKFGGSSRLVWFPKDGFPQTVFSRVGIGFFQLARHGDYVLITAGDEGELLGYDPQQRRNLLFAGARASQVNAIVPLPHGGSDFLLIGNNPASLERMSWARDANAELVATTRRIDLGGPAELGALRVGAGGAGGQLSVPANMGLRVEMRSSYSSDPLEGWGEWHEAIRHSDDPAWYAAENNGAQPEGAPPPTPLRGRYVQLRLSARVPAFEVSGARLYSLPQNQHPQLSSFTVLPPSNARNSADTLRKAAEAAKIGYRDDLATAADTPLYRSSRVIIWDLSDANGDVLLSTLSIHGPEDDADAQWEPVLVDSENRFAIFDTAPLPEGRYRTRLDVRETAPRPAPQRLSISFSTDDFVVDRSPPEILHTQLERTEAGGLTLTVQARDALSLLRGAEFHLNNGTRYTVSHPLDGILDGREEGFALELSPAQLGTATAVEIIVLDEHFNSASTRVDLRQ
ncbi:hypothetical protein [Cephaloticoccus primus]|nr:hypothetical protein [Cephaloticoccus primus]